MSKFTSEGQMGNKNAKKDFTKEMATHVTSQEMYHAAKMISQVPVRELEEMNRNGDLKNESLLTYACISKAVKGDFKPLQFIVEMICGKAKQMVDPQMPFQPDHQTLTRYMYK